MVLKEFLPGIQRDMIAPADIKYFSEIQKELRDKICTAIVIMKYLLNPYRKLKRSLTRERARYKDSRGFKKCLEMYKIMSSGKETPQRVKNSNISSSISRSLSKNLFLIQVL